MLIELLLCFLYILTVKSPVHCEWLDVACPCHVQLCAAAAVAVAAAAAAVAVAVAAVAAAAVAAAAAAAAAAAEVEAAAVAAVSGGSDADVDADVGVVDAAGERTAPVAVETGIGSTQQGVACGRVGPGRRTQGATALAAPSHLMRKNEEECDRGYLRTKTQHFSYTSTPTQQFVIHMSHYLPPTQHFQMLKPLWII